MFATKEEAEAVYGLPNYCMARDVHEWKNVDGSSGWVAEYHCWHKMTRHGTRIHWTCCNCGSKLIQTTEGTGGE